VVNQPTCFEIPSGILSRFLRFMERLVQFPGQLPFGVVRFLIYGTAQESNVASGFFNVILQPDLDTKEPTNHFQSANDFVDGMSKGMICAMVPQVPIAGLCCMCQFRIEEFLVASSNQTISTTMYRCFFTSKPPCRFSWIFHCHL
jgi:hypothetical protein